MPIQAPTAKKGSVTTEGTTHSTYVNPDAGYMANTEDAQRRRKAIQQAYKIAELQGQQVSGMQKQLGTQTAALDQAAQQDQMRLRQQGAQALAAGQAQSGGLGGGGGYGALLQTSQQTQQATSQSASDAAMRRAALEGEWGERIQEGQLAAAQQMAEAQKFEAEAGTDTENWDKKRANADTRIEAAIKEYRDDLIGEQEDAAAAVERLAETETDPEIKAYLQTRAQDLKHNRWDI